MKLGTFDRLILLNILPEEGDITTIRILHGLKQRLSFTEEEHSALQFRNENGAVFWRQEADQEKEIEIGSKAEQIILAALEKLSKEKKLKEQHLSVCEKFGMLDG